MVIAKQKESNVNKTELQNIRWPKWQTTQDGNKCRVEITKLTASRLRFLRRECGSGAYKLGDVKCAESRLSARQIARNVQ